MARLEENSIPVLDPLISGLELQLLSSRQQRQIALWATKTAMMADQTQAVPLLPGQQLVRLRTHRAIPSGTHIWMGACRELYPVVTSHTVEIELETIGDANVPRQQGFYAPMKVGHLCLYVYFASRDVVAIPPRDPYMLALARIWPRRGEIGWPPPGQMRDGPAFEVFADRFWRDWTLLRRSPRDSKAPGCGDARRPTGPRLAHSLLANRRMNVNDERIAAPAFPIPERLIRGAAPSPAVMPMSPPRSGI